MVLDKGWYQCFYIEYDPRSVSRQYLSNVISCFNSTHSDEVILKYII